MWEEEQMGGLIGEDESDESWEGSDELVTLVVLHQMSR